MGWQDFTQRVLPFMGADLLLSDLSHKLAPSQVYIPTLENGYGALVIATSTPSAACVVTCQVVDATGIVPPWSQRQQTDTIDPVMFTPPYSYTTASALRITLTASVNQVISSVTFIWGVSSVAPSQQGSQLIRADGRAYPIGSLGATSFLLAAGSTPLIAAPGAGLHILLDTMSFSYAGASGAGLGGSIGITVGGVVLPIVDTSAQGFVQSAIPGGILCDANTAVNLNQSGAGVTTAAVTYDVVA